MARQLSNKTFAWLVNGQTVFLNLSRMACTVDYKKENEALGTDSVE
jgi:hypothetical protein